MLVLAVTLKIHPDNAEQARASLSRLAEAAPQMDGVYGFNLGEDPRAPGVFHLTEVYGGYDVKDSVESSEIFLEVLDSIKASFLAPPNVDIYEVTETK